MEAIKKAHKKAVKARERAYAPYSRYLVGAAVVLENGEIVEGCNVENASYGATICAERVAITHAMARFGKSELRALVLVTDPAATPCGLCLQVLTEFCAANFPIYLSTPKKLGKKRALKELLPMPFEKKNLGKK